MKASKASIVILLLGSLLTESAQAEKLGLPPIADGPFKADWNSLTNYQCPEWFRDAKFGIWSHFGPDSIPGFNNYARDMWC